MPISPKADVQFQGNLYQNPNDLFRRHRKAAPRIQVVKRILKNNVGNFLPFFKTSLFKNLLQTNSNQNSVSLKYK